MRYTFLFFLSIFYVNLGHATHFIELKSITTFYQSITFLGYDEEIYYVEGRCDGVALKASFIHDETYVFDASLRKLFTLPQSLYNFRASLGKKINIWSVECLPKINLTSSTPFNPTHTTSLSFGFMASVESLLNFKDSYFIRSEIGLGRSFNNTIYMNTYSSPTFLFSGALMTLLDRFKYGVEIEVERPMITPYFNLSFVHISGNIGMIF